jgi:hypothetical protein
VVIARSENRQTLGKIIVNVSDWSLLPIDVWAADFRPTLILFD